MADLIPVSDPMGVSTAQGGTGSNAEGYVPNDEERKAIKLANDLFEKSKSYRKQYDEKWLDYYKMFRGKQWSEQRPTYRHSEVINMVFKAIQSVVPIMTDSRPRIEYLPRHPESYDLATILNDVASSDWDKNNWLMTIAEGLYDSHLYGTFYFSVDYDPKADFGVGDVVFETADPFYCYPDPNARDVNDRRSKFFIHAEPVDVGTLKEQYPDKAKFIKPDLIDIAKGKKQDQDQVRFKSPVDTKTILEGTSAYDVGAKDQALKITCFVRSDEFVEEEHREADPSGIQRTIFTQKLKYPNGRKIEIASGVCLYDGPNPYDDGKFPYVKGVNYILPREFFGISEVEQLQSPQKIFNKLVSFALDVLTLTGNPIWVVDNTSGIDTDNLFNRPGLVVEKEPGTEVRREAGTQLQPYVLELIDRLRSWFDDESGATDVSQGSTPSGVTSGVAISTLQEAAQTRIRQKSRNLDAVIQGAGQLYMSRVFQFCSAPKIYRISGSANANKYFKFHVEQVLDEQGNPKLQDDGSPMRMAHVTPFNVNEQGQGSWAETQKMLIQGEFDVKCGTGSSLPFAKQEKTQMSLNLFDRQIIDAEEVLKNTDYPNYEAVIDRMTQKAQAAAAQQQAQGGGRPNH